MMFTVATIASTIVIKVNQISIINKKHDEITREIHTIGPTDLSNYRPIYLLLTFC